MKYIMLHGLGQSSESWSDTVKVFNDDFEVLCPNLSDWLSGKTPCYDTLYRTLETYCEQFEEPLNICGLFFRWYSCYAVCDRTPRKNELISVNRHTI